MFGGSEWLFSAGATPGGTMGQQAKERHMRAVVITEPGEPEVMQWLDVPDPSPGPGEVAINYRTEDFVAAVLEAAHVAGGSGAPGDGRRRARRQDLAAPYLTRWSEAAGRETD
jgi:hypothetical protein